MQILPCYLGIVLETIHVMESLQRITCKVLQRSNRLEESRILPFLHATNVLHGIVSTEERIFSRSFLSPSPARISKDIDIRLSMKSIPEGTRHDYSPEIQSSNGFIHEESSSFRGNSLSNVTDQSHVEGRSESDGHGEGRGTPPVCSALGEDSVERLCPPLISRNGKSRDRRSLVQSLQHLLLQSQLRHQSPRTLLQSQ